MTLYPMYPLTLVSSVRQTSPWNMGLSILCPSLCPGRLTHVGYTVAPSVTRPEVRASLTPISPYSHLSSPSSPAPAPPGLRRHTFPWSSLLVDSSSFPLLLGCLRSPCSNSAQAPVKGLFMFPTVSELSGPSTVCRVFWQACFRTFTL